jgi:hypothetical protein
VCSDVSEELTEAANNNSTFGIVTGKMYAASLNL